MDPQTIAFYLLLALATAFGLVAAYARYSDWFGHGKRRAEAIAEQASDE